MGDQELLTAIGQMIDEKLEEALDRKFDEKLFDIRQDIKDIKSEMGSLERHMADIDTDIREFSRRVSSLELHIENATDRSFRFYFDYLKKENMQCS